MLWAHSGCVSSPGPHTRTYAAYEFLVSIREFFVEYPCRNSCLYAFLVPLSVRIFRGSVCYKYKYGQYTIYRG